MHLRVPLICQLTYLSTIFKQLTHLFEGALEKGVAKLFEFHDVVEDDEFVDNLFLQLCL